MPSLSHSARLPGRGRRLGDRRQKKGRDRISQKNGDGDVEKEEEERSRFDPFFPFRALFKSMKKGVRKEGTMRGEEGRENNTKVGRLSRRKVGNGIMESFVINEQLFGGALRTFTVHKEGRGERAANS